MIYRDALLVILFTACSFFAVAQPPSPDPAITATVQQLFKGMETGDSALVHATFAHNITMATVRRDKAGNPVLQREASALGFLKAVGTPHPQTWYEEIWDVKVQQDGDFAQVWCDYAFYIGNTFSHCGVDAFQLHKQKDGWKIFHLADTRRTENCAIPKSIQQKHNP